jgi:hypothetical protein
MTPSIFYATATFLVGLLLLLLWLYLSADTARSVTILTKSVVIFVLPSAVLAAALPSRVLAFRLGVWIAVLIEECLKAVASVTEKERSSRFFLVVLFGVWEFALVKPLGALLHPALLDSLDTFELTGLTIRGLIVVLMHTVTAELYAFKFAKNIMIPLCISCVLHIIFDETINSFAYSLLSALIWFVLLLILLCALWPKDASLRSLRQNMS